MHFFVLTFFFPSAVPNETNLTVSFCLFADLPGITPSMPFFSSPLSSRASPPASPAHRSAALSSLIQIRAFQNKVGNSCSVLVGRKVTLSDERGTEKTPTASELEREREMGGRLPCKMTSEHYMTNKGTSAALPQISHCSQSTLP